MANIVPNSAKADFMNGVHLAADTYKMALVTSLAGLSASSTTYTGLANEVANGNGYTTGGATLSGRSVTGTTTARLDFTSPTWPASTITAVGGVIYNDTKGGKNIVMVVDFGGSVSSTNDTFTATMPAVGDATSLFRIA